MATYFIDYENPIGQSFVTAADSFSFRPCSCMPDYYRTYETILPCTSFWETVRRSACWLCDGCEPLMQGEINAMNNLCRDCDNHCVSVLPDGAKTPAEIKALGKRLERSKSADCGKHCWQQCSCNRVILFYSVSGKKDRNKIEKIIPKCTEVFEYKPNGVSNGLDFQLVTYLGSAIYDDTHFFSDTRFYIVSGDNGFGSAIHFWENDGDMQLNGISFALLQSEAEIIQSFLANAPFGVDFDSIDSPSSLNHELQKYISNGAELKKLNRLLKPLFT